MTTIEQETIPVLADNDVSQSRGVERMRVLVHVIHELSECQPEQVAFVFVVERDYVAECAVPDDSPVVTFRGNWYLKPIELDEATVITPEPALVQTVYRTLMRERFQEGGW